MINKENSTKWFEKNALRLNIFLKEVTGQNKYPKLKKIFLGLIEKSEIVIKNTPSKMAGYNFDESSGTGEKYIGLLIKP